MSVKAVLGICAISLNYSQSSPFWSLSIMENMLLIISVASLMACSLGSSSSMVWNISSSVSRWSLLVSYCLKTKSSSF